MTESLFTNVFDAEWLRFMLKAMCAHLYNLAKKADVIRNAKGTSKNEVSSLYMLKARSRFEISQNRLMNDRSALNYGKSGMYILVAWNLRSLFQVR